LYVGMLAINDNNFVPNRKANTNVSMLTVHHVLCVHHLPCVSSVEACSVGGEDGEWISSFFGASANVNEHDKMHHFVYGHALISLQCTHVALQPGDVHLNLSLYDVSRLCRMLTASILGVNRYTYLIPVSFLGLADFSSIVEVRGEDTGSF